MLALSIQRTDKLGKLGNSEKSTKVSLLWAFHLQIKFIDYSPTQNKFQSSKNTEK